MSKVSFDVIEEFLEGRDPQKHIVSIESNKEDNFVYLVVNDPETGKRIEKHKYKPFLWMKHDITKIIYNGNRRKITEEARKYDIRFKKLRTNSDDGSVPKRMDNGYKYLVQTRGSFSDLEKFFIRGGVNIRKEEYRPFFVILSLDEQFLIQTGKRLFKGMDDYNDVHKMQFDLETEGLDPMVNAIFQIGVRDNKGFELVMETRGETPSERRDSERKNIIDFFNIVNEKKPDILTAYNSENFDWPFFENRCLRLGLDLYKIVKTLNPNIPMKRKDATLKLGGEQESYKQTYIWGMNVLDISHSVRRAQAINSNIKRWSLKYITQFSRVAKKNRVYVDGDIIHKTWADTNDYWFNNDNGQWGLLSSSEFINERPENVQVVKGEYIVQRYLLDDLWETEQVDNIYNQAAYLIAKIIPTSYMRSSTMGTAGQWKLIMAAWSYENNLAIPELQKKRDFTGGLSRLLEVGYARNVVKADFAALYPKTELTWKIFPDLDISGVMEGLLTYVVDKRDEFKFLTGEHKDKAKELEALLEKNKHKLSDDRITKAKSMIEENKTLGSNYDKKQLPLKILANSFFGAYGAPYIFNWGDSDCAEETTCRGRQYLRLMVKFFKEKYDFKPLVGDSVTYDTPVYIKYPNGLLDIKPICELFDEITLDIDGQQRDFSPKSFEILTRNGWKNIKYVYRHETTKNIHRIATKDSLVNVTEDHSVFANGVKVLPSTLKRGDKIDIYDKFEHYTSINNITEDQAWLYGFFLGDGSANCSSRKNKYKSRKTGEIHYNNSSRSDWKISNSKIGWLEKLQAILKNDFHIESRIKDHMKSSSVYNLVVHKADFTKEFCSNFYTSYREKKVPSFILNANLDIKRAFLNGVCASDGYGDDLETCVSIGMKSQIAMAGLAFLFRELNIEYKIILRKDKQSFITFNLKNRGYLSNFTDKTIKQTDEVWTNDIILNKDKDNFVYDVSTEDGSFIAGINGICCSNTDGMNFTIPDNIDEVKYITQASHWKTKHYEVGQELTGLDAVLAEFNETYMIGRMGLDIDDICNATINFARKNYANDIDGKVKLVGNSIKSKAMPEYIEEFIDKGVRMLLDGKGYDFIEYYYEHVDRIYNYQIPALKMASKSRVKMNPKTYVDVHCNAKNKNGQMKSRQAHMELILKHELDVNLGDTIYYINVGTSKSHADIKNVKDKITKKPRIEFNCKLLPQHEIDTNPDYITTDYNVPKYLDAFNKRIKPLLVCFSPEIRDSIIIDVAKDKKTKLIKLQERSVFTESQCELTSGQPYNKEDQDTYEDLMTMEDKEIRFWDSVNKIPNNMEEDEWEAIRKDYHVRRELNMKNDIQLALKQFDDIIKRFELPFYEWFKYNLELPDELSSFILFDDETEEFILKKWDVPIATLLDMFKYYDEAIQRDEFYQTLDDDIEAEEKYNLWLNHLNPQESKEAEKID